jgi:hypothetical protein
MTSPICLLATSSPLEPKPITAVMIRHDPRR